LLFVLKSGHEFRAVLENLGGSMAGDLPSRFDSAELVRRFKNDEQSAAGELYNEYAQRLIALARTRLPAMMARRLDPEDILQSVFRSFFVGLRAERWTADEIDDLWRLLAGITLNKLGENVRFHSRWKRSEAREVETDDGLREGRDGPALSREPSPADIVAAAEELAWLLEKFSVEERRAIELRLRRHTIEEISRLIGRSGRTIRRWIEQARDLLESRAAKFAESRMISHSNAPQSASLELAALATLDHRDFQLEQLIGSGGMCKVYAARERATGLVVCIKVMRKRQRYQRQLVARFLHEAELVSKLEHSRIVAGRGVGRLPDGGYFMCVELVDGTNLADAIKSGRSSQSAVLGSLGQIADALDYCHQHGIVHCDVQPRNILLSHDGRAMLTDFGFARRFDGTSPRDGSDDFIAGTPGFMAPEQLEGLQIAPATDVYGIGAVLYWALTGNIPYDARDSGLGQPDQLPLPPFPDDVRVELRELCKRCLAPTPETRTISMSEVSAELRTLAS
jgi:RNA polymerase sigma factor (sigma-70 family)